MTGICWQWDTAESKTGSQSGVIAVVQVRNGCDLSWSDSITVGKKWPDFEYILII